MESVITGTIETIAILDESGKQERVNVKIPKGMTSGKKLRLSGKGQHPGPFGGHRGDLYIQIEIIPHPVFTLDDHNLVIEREIKLTDALLGTSINVPTIDGKQLSLKVPAGTRSHTKLRLKGYGIPFADKEGRGDQYVQINVSFPKHLTKKQKDLVVQLASAGV